VKQDELNYLLIVGGSTLAQAALFCLAYAFPGTNGKTTFPLFAFFWLLCAPIVIVYSYKLGQKNPQGMED